MAVAIGSVLCTACDDGDDEPICDPSEVISGITETNDKGVVGTIDSDDWCPKPQGNVRINSLSPAYPNPSDSNVRIRYSLAHDNETVLLYVLNSECDQIRTLVDRVESGAEHEVYWNFADDDSVRVPPGLYRVIIQLDDFQCHGDIELQYPQDWVP